MFVAPYKPQEREEARRLRREQGVPIKRIAARLAVSPGTVHAWTRDIILTPEQRARNATGPTGPQNPAQIRRRAEAIRRGARGKRREYQAEGRLRARDGDALHQTGCMLYWAEGSKLRNSVVFVNSDRPMVEHFVRFLRESLGVTSDEITVRLNVYLTNGLTLREVENHWLWALGLPRSSLRKHAINHAPTSSSGLRRDKLP
jgi:DNA-binding transcriptional regulator YiaG